MNKKERQALLKILLIREELTDKEFCNVIDFIRQELDDKQDTEKIVKKQFSMKKKSRDSVTNLILSLKDKQQENYEIINSLYRLVQDGTVFSSVSDARKFADILGLKNTNSYNKTEVIYQIFHTLVSMEKEKLISVASRIEMENDKTDEKYLRLSEFIMESRKGE